MRHTAQHEDIRESILDAADRLIERYGYRKMTVDDIAREAGIGKGTVYLHFPSKEEVALCSMDRVNARLRERLREISESDHSPIERIREMLLTRVLFRFDSAHKYSSSLDEVLADLRPGLLARREHYHEAEAQIIARVLEEGKAEGVFRISDSHCAAHALITATNSLLPYGLSVRQLGERDEIASRVISLTDLIFHGLLCFGGVIERRAAERS